MNPLVGNAQPAGYGNGYAHHHHHHQPPPYGIGIFPQHFARNPETIVLKEKIRSFSGDDFDVKFVSGTPLFKVKGAVLSLSGRKSIYDASGSHLFDIKKELFHIHTTFAFVTPEGHKIGELRNTLFKLLGSQATCTIYPADSAPVSLVMRGNWLDTEAKIVDESTGMPVASVFRPWMKMRDLVFNKQTYNVSITPGTDMSVIAAMCICLDEKENEGK